MSAHAPAYRGRFAPSPTGLLHFGSLVCALASYLDARAHDGTWLIRIEDIDPPRDMPGADLRIIETLAALGMTSDEPIVWQSRRSALYEKALALLTAKGLVYGCACSRKEIAAAQQDKGHTDQTVDSGVDQYGSGAEHTEIIAGGAAAGMQQHAIAGPGGPYRDLTGEQTAQNQGNT